MFLYVYALKIFINQSVLSILVLSNINVVEKSEVISCNYFEPKQKIRILF